MRGGRSATPGMGRRIADILRSHQLADRVHDARSLIISGRVLLDGMPVRRPGATVPPGRHTLRVVTYGGNIDILVQGIDDFRV